MDAPCHHSRSVILGQSYLLPQLSNIPTGYTSLSGHKTSMTATGGGNATKASRTSTEGSAVTASPAGPRATGNAGTRAWARADAPAHPGPGAWACPGLGVGGRS